MNYKYLLSLFLFGCAAETYEVRWVVGEYNGPKQIHTFCLDIDEARAQESRSAFATWNKALNGWKEFVEVPFKINCDIPVTMEVDSGPVKRYATAFGNLKLKAHYIVIFDLMGTEVTYVTMLHEIGHLLGANHQGRTLMDPFIYPDISTCPDKPTVSQVTVKWNMRIEQLTYCYRKWHD